jgi:hypothetical protein
MRSFWIENAHGKLWNLTSPDITDKNASFFAEPDGLGIKTKIESYEVENTFFIESVTTQSQTISGDIYFSSYEHFSRFVDFIGNVNTKTPLKLYYSIDGVSHDNNTHKQRYKLVLITKLKEGEVNVKTSALKVGIKFDVLSRWKKDQEITLELSRTGGPLVYPYIYPYVYGGSNNLAVVIDNTGNLPTTCRVRVDGVTDTPLFRIIQDEVIIDAPNGAVNNNAVIIDQARYHITVGANSYLIVDSSADSQEASLYTTNNGETTKEDVYYTGERDYAFSNFITIPTGISTFLVSALNANFGKVTLSYSTMKELI